MEIKTHMNTIVTAAEDVAMENSDGQEGYMTVEAAFLMPMALCLVVFVLYLGFFLYDRCTLEQDAYLHAYQKSIERGHTARPEGSLADSCRSTFLLSSRGEELKGGGTVTCTVHAQLGAEVFQGYFLMPKGWEIDVRESARQTDPPHSFRRVRRIAALLRMAQEQ